jgi:hypothetical protein
VIGTINTEPITLDEALDQVDAIISNKTQAFLSHNNKPIRAFTSGGVDSTLVLAYLSKYTDAYTLIQCAHIDYDKFWLLNSETIQSNYWAYKQIHHWRDSCVLTSGTPGDEFMLRSPVTVNWILRNHGLSVNELLATEEYSDCLHKDYFLQNKHANIFASDFAPVSSQQLIYQVCDTIVNDWQHWHLGNTLTWTPLRDLAITKIMLRVPVADLVRQIMNSEFSRKLILRTCPVLNAVISDKKNSGNYMSNLVDLYCNTSASSGQ